MMSYNSQHAYTSLVQGEESSIEESPKFSGEYQRKRPTGSIQRQIHLQKIACSVLTGMNIIVLSLSIYVFYLSQRSCAFAQGSVLIKLPFLDRPDFPTEELIVNINGSVFDTVPPSIYRQPPSPDVDAAWERISHTGVHMLGSAEVRSIGKDPNITVRAPESWGYGKDAHLAQFDVFHQIHCLNVLRKEAYYEHYFKDIYGDRPPSELHMVHLGYCLYVLLQNLMCTSNVDPITYTWKETQDVPYPDFYMNHQCRNFEAIVDWQSQYEISTHLVVNENWTIPEGAVVLPASKTMLSWAQRHNESSTHHMHR